MNIICLVGSPRGSKSNTARLARLVLEGAESAGAQSETIFINGNIKPCKACDTCHKKGRCPQKDDFETIKQKIMDADGVVLASPNYISSVSAQLKAFLDRCCGVIHCLGFEGRYGLSVVTSGGGEDQPIADYMNQFLQRTGIRTVGSVHVAMGELPDEQFPPELQERARLLGQTLIQSINDQIRDPQVEKEIESFKERMRQLISWRRAEWPFEFDYWKKHRGLPG